MNARSDAEQWHEMASHLVQAHGAQPGGLLVYAPTLEQLRFAHADTHVALASIKTLPPDLHTHPLPVDAGWFERRESSYRPFRPSASARDDPFCFPSPHQTGLPHTYVFPLHEGDLAQWTTVRPFHDAPAGWIKDRAARAAAAWRARFSQSPPRTGPAINSATPQRRQTAGAACPARDQAAMTVPALTSRTPGTSRHRPGRPPRLRGEPAVSRALGPGPSAGSGGAAAGWAVLITCWSAVAVSGLIWAAAAIAGAITGGRTEPLGMKFTRDLLHGRSQDAWPHTPTAAVVITAVLMAAAVAALGCGGRPADRPVAGSAGGPGRGAGP